MNPRAIDSTRSDCSIALRDQAHLLAPLKGDTLVVTGGTGFTGTWIAEMIACLNDEHSFGVKLHLLSRSTDRFKIACPHLAGRKDITLIKSDVRHTMEVSKDTGWLIHAAANPDNRFHATNPIETMTVIADGTSTILRTVDRCSNFKMFLNVSSGLVYGSQPWEMERIAETFHGAPVCGSVSSAYAEAKRYAETLCSAARSQARIPLLTVRPFAFIGPYQSLDTPWAINNFIRDALSGNPIRVFGDGQTVRSYMYPSDMAFWLLRILTGGTSGLTYNLGSPTGVTLEQVAGMVSNHFTPRPEIRLRTASNAAQNSRFVPDVALAGSALGLSLKIDLETAIERTIRWNQQS